MAGAVWGAAAAENRGAPTIFAGPGAGAVDVGSSVAGVSSRTRAAASALAASAASSARAAASAAARAAAAFTPAVLAEALFAAAVLAAAVLAAGLWAAEACAAARTTVVFAADAAFTASVLAAAASAAWLRAAAAFAAFDWTAEDLGDAGRSVFSPAGRVGRLGFAGVGSAGVEPDASMAPVFAASLRVAASSAVGDESFEAIVVLPAVVFAAAVFGAVALDAAVFAAAVFPAAVFDAAVFPAAVFPTAVFPAAVFDAAVFDAAVFDAAVFPAALFDAESDEAVVAASGLAVRARGALGVADFLAGVVRAAAVAPWPAAASSSEPRPSAGPRFGFSAPWGSESGGTEVTPLTYQVPSDLVGSHLATTRYQARDGS